jgi:hypothetical protein
MLKNERDSKRSREEPTVLGIDDLWLFDDYDLESPATITLYFVPFHDGEPGAGVH